MIAMKRSTRLLVLSGAAIVAIAAAVLGSRKEPKKIEAPVVSGAATDPVKGSPEGARHSRALMYLLR